MISHEMTQSVLALSEDERLELARRLIESVQAGDEAGEGISEGVRRIEEVATGRVNGLTEEQFRSALQ